MDGAERSGERGRKSGRLASTLASVSIGAVRGGVSAAELDALAISAVEAFSARANASPRLSLSTSKLKRAPRVHSSPADAFCAECSNGTPSTATANLEASRQELLPTVALLPLKESPISRPPVPSAPRRGSITPVVHEPPVNWLSRLITALPTDKGRIFEFCLTEAMLGSASKLASPSDCADEEAPVDDVSAASASSDINSISGPQPPCSAQATEVQAPYFPTTLDEAQTTNDSSANIQPPPSLDPVLLLVAPVSDSPAQPSSSTFAAPLPACTTANVAVSIDECPVIKTASAIASATRAVGSVRTSSSPLSLSRLPPPKVFRVLASQGIANKPGEDKLFFSSFTIPSAAAAPVVSRLAQKARARAAVSGGFRQDVGAPSAGVKRTPPRLDVDAPLEVVAELPLAAEPLHAALRQCVNDPHDDASHGGSGFDTQAVLLGCVDGHGTDACAAYISVQLPQHVQRRVQSIGTAHVTAEDVSAALERACADAEGGWARECRQNRQDRRSGACASFVLVVQLPIGWHLFTVNIGDCRSMVMCDPALLSTENDRPTSVPLPSRVVPVSSSATDTNSSEVDASAKRRRVVIPIHQPVVQSDTLDAMHSLQSYFAECATVRSQRLSASAPKSQPTSPYGDSFLQELLASVVAIQLTEDHKCFLPHEVHSLARRVDIMADPMPLRFNIDKKQRARAATCMADARDNLRYGELGSPLPLPAGCSSSRVPLSVSSGSICDKMRWEQAAWHALYEIFSSSPVEFPCTAASGEDSFGEDCAGAGKKRTHRRNGVSWPTPALPEGPEMVHIVARKNIWLEYVWRPLLLLHCHASDFDPRGMPTGTALLLPGARELVQQLRIAGEINVSRTFGDAYLKGDNHPLTNVRHHDIRSDSSSCGKGPDVLPLFLFGSGGRYLSAVPSITVRRLTRADRMIVVGTDGLFDHTSCAGVAAVVLEALTRQVLHLSSPEITLGLDSIGHPIADLTPSPSGVTAVRSAFPENLSPGISKPPGSAQCKPRAGPADSRVRTNLMGGSQRSVSFAASNTYHSPAPSYHTPTSSSPEREAMLLCTVSTAVDAACGTAAQAAVGYAWHCSLQHHAASSEPLPEGNPRDEPRAGSAAKVASATGDGLPLPDARYAPFGASALLRNAAEVFSAARPAADGPASFPKDLASLLQIPQGVAAAGGRDPGRRRNYCDDTTCAILLLPSHLFETPNVGEASLSAAAAATSADVVKIVDSAPLLATSARPSGTLVSEQLQALHTSAASGAGPPCSSSARATDTTSSAPLHPPIESASPISHDIVNVSTITGSAVSSAAVAPAQVISKPWCAARSMPGVTCLLKAYRRAAPAAEATQLAHPQLLLATLGHPPNSQRPPLLPMLRVVSQSKEAGGFAGMSIPGLVFAPVRRVTTVPVPPPSKSFQPRMTAAVSLQEAGHLRSFLSMPLAAVTVATASSTANSTGDR